MDIPLDEVVHFDAITSHPTTGAVTDADATPTWSIFEEDTDTAILSAQDFTKRTALTGNYRGSATLSTANGFEVGKWYHVIGSATVNAIAGKAVVMRFRVVSAESIVGQPKVDLAALGGTGQSATDLKDFADDGYDPATNKVQGVVLVDTLTTYTGNTLQTGDLFPLVSTEIADIKAKTDALPSDPADQSLIVAATDAIMSRLGVAGAGLTALGDTRIANLDATISSRATPAQANAECDTAIADAALATAANLATVAGYLDTEISAILADTNELQADWVNGGRLDNILDARSSQTSVDDLPTNAELATALGTADDAVLVVLAKFETALELDGAVWRFTANSLELAPGGAGSDPWLTALPGAYGAGTAGKIVGDNVNATISSRATPAQVNTEVDTALIAKGLDHMFVAAVAGTDIADNSFAARIASKSATADWDSYDNTTESLEAIRDHGDSAWITGSGGGTGVIAVTITVKQAVTLILIQNATVTLVMSGIPYTETTNASGVAVLHPTPGNGTYEVRINEASHEPLTPVNLVVAGDTAAEYQLALTVITPSVPPFVTAVIVAYDTQMNPKAGVTIYLQQTGPIPTAFVDGVAFDGSIISAVSGVNGVAQFPGRVKGATYRYQTEEITRSAATDTIPVDAVDGYQIGSIITR